MEYNHSYIICLNDNTVYPGAREAGRVLGVDHSTITKVCQNKRKHTKGYRFAYFINPLEFPNYKYYSVFDNI